MTRQNSVKSPKKFLKEIFFGAQGVNGATSEIYWGLRDFSLVVDSSDPVGSTEIYATKSVYPMTVQGYSCGSVSGMYPAIINPVPLCMFCNSPCQECYGGGSDQCFSYTENRLCPVGQTFTSSGCIDCLVENCPTCDLDINKCDTCLTS